MALVSNPTKKITVNFSVNTIKAIMNRVPELASCKLQSEDNIINEYEFDFTSFMIGNIITVSLNEISEEKTEINFEARRFLGAYDTATEIMTANSNLKTITQAISSLIADPEAKKPEPQGCAGATAVLLFLIVFGTYSAFA